MWDGPLALIPPYPQSHCGETAQGAECSLFPRSKPKQLTGGNDSSLPVYWTRRVCCETWGRELECLPSPGTSCLCLKVEERLPAGTP